MIFLCLLILIACPLGALCQFNMTAYRQMPLLYTFDDYDVCLEPTEPSSYCLVIGEIVPNDTSVLWNQIANFSSVTKRHFRHDLLYFGVCLNRCKQLVDALSPTEKDQLHTGIIQNTNVVEFFTDVLERETDNRILYDKLINTCLNYNFQKQYPLQLRTFTEYCVSNKDSLYIGFWEIVLYTMVGTLLFLAVLSSNYDRQLKAKASSDLTGNEFYKRKLHTQQDTLLTSFSMQRNYFRFVVPSRGEALRDLQFLECYRFFAIVLIIVAHVVLLLKSMPTRNPEFIEASYYRIGSNILINGTVIIQVFLVMSSFFLCLGFNQFKDSIEPGISAWGHLILYRYVRLVPSLAFMILVNATILPRLQNGPFWEHAVSAEYELCRKTWWKNLLFINNFTMKKSCLHQTWYLATDFQLYAIMCAVLLFIKRFPKTRNYILGAGVAISFLSTGMVTYFLKLHGTHQEAPDSYRYLFWTDGDTIYKGNVPFYTNFGGCVFGTISGLIYLHFKHSGLNLKEQKAKLNRILILASPLPLLVLLSGEIFFRYEFPRPSIWVAIYSGLFRNIWAAGSCVLLLLMCFKVGSVFYKFASLPIFAPLGRLTYQVFLLHSLVIRMLAGNFRQPVHASYTILVMHILSNVVICIFVSFFLYILLELPLTILINSFLKAKTANNLKPIVLSSIQTSLENKNEVPTTDTPEPA